MSAIWLQNYDPLHRPLLSTLVAAAPVVVLLASIALLQIRIHLSALLGLAVALAIAVGFYHMPASAAAASTIYGACFGLFPIGWIILNVIFLYQLTVQRGQFDLVRQSLGRLAPDPRLQLILIAFSFGAFIEGIAGFGTPVAITGAILIQLGFRPLHASGLALIANTAPVAFGSLGIPITTLEQVTGLDSLKISAMVGRQLPFFSLLVPFWVVAAFAGWRGMLEIWPAALVAGAAFAIPQFLISNLHGPWLVDMVSGACSMAALVTLLRFWSPRQAAPAGRPADALAPTQAAGSGTTPPQLGRVPSQTAASLQSPAAAVLEAVKHPATTHAPSRREQVQSWMPWLILTIFILIWGLPHTRSGLDAIASPKWPVPRLHNLVQRTAPIAPPHAKPEPAEYKLNYLSATGTGILLAAVVAGLLMGFGPRAMLGIYLRTVWRIRYSLLTIAMMLALGTLTRYSGTDATLGLALAHTGSLSPFFGTLLGWVGVALTGSDTASNVLFGSLQRITAEQTGLSPVLMAAANSSGGVMGKMIDAQSIVVASTATNWYGQEGSILRYVFWHSLALAMLMAALVLLQAYCPPFSRLVVP